MRTTRQRSKPVILTVKKTEFGYEVLEDKSAEPVLEKKSTGPKANKVASPAKSSVSKSGDKEGDSVSATATPVTTRPVKTKGAPKSNLKATKQHQRELKSPSVQTESEAMKKDDINTFASPSELNSTVHQESAKNEAGSAVEKERPEKPDTVSKSERPERFERAEKMVKIVEPKFTEPKLLDLNSYEHLKVLKKYPVMIPTIASWFDFDKIDQREKEGLPEFFSGKPSKTPEVYKKYRNFIVNLYRSNPRHYLHATTCRRSLAGDVNGIMRLHAFLEQWGLINFNVDPTTYPQNLFMTKPSYGLDSRFKVKARGVKSEFVEQEKRNQIRNSENDLLLSQIRILNKQARPYCHGCGFICGIVWYHQKGGAYQQNQAKMYDQGMATEDTIVCLKCFTEGHLPNMAAQTDFHRVDLLNKYNSNFPKNPNPSFWTQEETLTLLELFSMDKDPWEDVPRYFPYKSKDDIILHWLQLPVKNMSLLESIGFEDDDKHDQTTAESLAELAEQGMFDTEFANPLMNHMGVFKEVLDKFTGKANKSKEAVHDEKFEEGEGIRTDEQQMEFEFGKGQEKSQEQEGAENLANGEAGESASVTKRPNIEIIQLAKVDKERKMVDERIERIFSIVDKEGEILEEVEKETRDRAEMMRKKEEDKIRETANILIDLQINKLEAKLSFLEEYEKVLGQEKKQNEMFQKMLLADRINLVQKKLDAAKPPPVVQTQQQLYDAREPAGYFNFNYQMGNVNIDDMLSLGQHENDFGNDGF